MKLIINLQQLVLRRFVLQAGGAKENVSVLVIRLNTDRGPSLARLRPTRQVLSIDDVEAAMAHDAALKAQRAARAEREAAVASLTSAAAEARSTVQQDPSARGRTSQSTVGAEVEAGSSLSGYTARMSFTSSDGAGDADEVTPQNSSDTLTSRAANVSTLSPSLTSTTATTNSRIRSSASTLSGQTLRVNFSATDDDEDELMKQLINRASHLSSEPDNDDEDVDVDDRFVRDMIRAELPPPPSCAFTGDVTAFSTQRQPRRRQRPAPDDHDQLPNGVDPSTTHQKPHFVKKSSSGASATTELGGLSSLRKNNASPMDCGETSAVTRRCSSSLPRSPGNLSLNVNGNVAQSPTQFLATKVSSNFSQAPVTSVRRSSLPESHRTPPCNQNITKPTPTPTLPSAVTRFGDSELIQQGDTQFFVEVARF